MRLGLASTTTARHPGCWAVEPYSRVRSLDAARDRFAYYDINGGDDLHGRSQAGPIHLVGLWPVENPIAQ